MRLEMIQQKYWLTLADILNWHMVWTSGHEIVGKTRFLEDFVIIPVNNLKNLTF